MPYPMNTRSASAILALFVLGPILVHAESPTTRPADRFRLGIVGLVHAHVYGFLDAALKRSDVEIVGMVDPHEELLNRYGHVHHKMPSSVLFADLDEMLDKAKPQAVAIFTDTADHPRVVEACARRGIHVMMEKPLAISVKDARAIQKSARSGNIQVLVNYETTWYPNTQFAWTLLKEQKRLGALRKFVFYTGHQGPKEIGVPREFLDWLTDPMRNGSGALHDFGCYGVDLATWLMDEQRPASVTAVTQHMKSDPAYQRVDDEATIVLTYPGTQAIIQASWNWPFNRKDMEVYGDRGSYLTVDRDQYRLHLTDIAESLKRADSPSPPATDPLSFLIAVAQKRAVADGPSSLPVNVIVTEVLDAARESARTGRTIHLDPSP